MSTLLQLDIAAAKVTEVMSGAVLPWPDPTPLADPVELVVLGVRTAEVALDGTAPVTVPGPAAWVTATTRCVSVGVAWDAVAGPVVLLDGGGLRLVLEPLDGLSATVVGTVHLSTGDVVLRGTVALATPPTTFTLALGDAAVLCQDGLLLDRRPVVAGPAPTAADDVWTVGAAADGTSPFVGRVLGLAAHDDLPSPVGDAAADGADRGIGEIAALVERSPGLGTPVEPEQVVGLVRWQRCSAALVAWSPSTGVHTVTGPVLDRYLALGGPLGALGLPTEEAQSLGGMLDLGDSRLRHPNVGLRLKDLLEERHVEPPNVVEVADLASVLDRVATRPERPLVDALRRGALDDGVSLADALATVDAGASAVTPSVLATEPDVVRAVTDRPAVVEVLDGLAAGRFAVHREGDTVRVRAGRGVGQAFGQAFGQAVGRAFGQQVDQGAGPLLGQRVEGLRHRAGRGLGRHVDHERDPQPQVEVAVDADVALAAVRVATSFVRNETLMTSIGSLDDPATAERSLGDLPDDALATMLVTADRIGAVTRVVDRTGIGWVLRGPRIARFERGVIVWAPGTGAVEVFTDILVHWLRHGGTDGFLGLPTTADTRVGAGRMARFAGGVVLWSPTAGAHEVHGAILAKYEELGGPTGFLGFPLSDEQAVPGGRMSSFEGGDVYWSAATGAHEIHGAIREAYLQRGGVDRYGVPVTDEVRWTAGDGSGAEVRHSTFATGELLAWVDGIGVFDHMVLQMSGVRSGDIDDEITSDDQPELWVETHVSVDGTEMLYRRTPDSGTGPTRMSLDGLPAVTVPLHQGASVRVYVEAWDEDTGPNDHFATHDVTYTLEGGWFGWLDAQRGSHAEAPSTWDSGDAGPDTFKVSYTLAPPFDEIARFGDFRRSMTFPFGNFTTARLGWDLYSETFEDVVDSSGSELVDDVLHPGDRLYFSERYKGVADGGNCFGFSTTTANTFHRRTGLAQPLNLHQQDPAVTRLINFGQGVQTDELLTLYKKAVFGTPGYLDPRKIFQRVQAQVDRRLPVLLCMRGMSGGKSVGHCTVAYRCDGSSWPKRIWIADSNVPAPGTADDNLSRIEIDADGTFRMYTGGANPSGTYGAGRFTGALGSSYLYDIPLAFAQGPHYTPNWLLQAGFGGVAGGLLVVDGDVDVTQVSGGGNDLFGDQRRRLSDHLGALRATITEALAAGLTAAEPVHVAPVVPVDAGPSPFDGVASRLDTSLALFAVTRALSDQVAVMAPRSASLTDAVATAGPQLWQQAGSSWGQQVVGRFDDHLADLDERISLVDVAAAIEADHRVLVPGAWPDMSFIPLEGESGGEMFVHSGRLPADLAVEVVGRGAFRQWAQTQLSGVLVRADEGFGGRRVVHLDRLSSSRPGVRIGTSSGAGRADVSLTVAVDLASRHWLGWQATVGVAADAPAAGLTRGAGPLGVVVETATAEPVVLRTGERVRAQLRNETRWTLRGGAGERLVATPADPASPFGALSVERTDATGRVLEQLVIDPTG